MSVTVVTGWTGRGFDALGDQFCRTLDRFWPYEIQAAVYVDNRLPAMPAARGAIRPLSHCVGLADFITRHNDDPRANGRKPQSSWREKERIAGYSWRHDTVKFATQLFIPLAASKHLPDGDILAWFDADVVTFADVPKNFIEGLLGDADLCFLGREPQHSEIGFWAVRLRPLVRDFLDYLPMLYCTGEIFELRETHSAFVFDEARRLFQQNHGLRARDLTPGGRGHVWFDKRHPLGRYTDHLKGPRKAVGRSRERMAA